MRVFFGIILGALLTVAVVFVADNWSSPTNGTPTTTERTMVNWDVVERQSAHRAPARPRGLEQAVTEGLELTA